MKSLNRRVVLAAVIFATAASVFATAAVLAVAAPGVTPRGTPNYDLDIVNPADEATVFSDNGDVSVRATVVPDLANGDQVEFLVDGLPIAPPTSVLDFPLYGIVHGQHMLQARIIDSTGNVGSISPSRTFYVWQASLLFPTGEE
jgi:hypothetical protein